MDTRGAEDATLTATEDRREHRSLRLALLLAPLALLGAQGPAQQDRPAEIRSLSVAVTQGKNDTPLESLVTAEIAVVENGVARPVTKVERDTRPLDVAILVDSSAAVGSGYRLNVVPAVLRFIQRLPKDSRYALWTTGDRPTKVVDLTTEKAEADKALKRGVPQGGSTVLDAIVEAGDDLKKKEGARRAIVVVAAVGIEFSGRDRYRVVEKARETIESFDAVLFEDSGLDTSGAARNEDRVNTEYVFGELAKATGGLVDRPLSALGVGTALDKIAADLQARFRVSYATIPEIKERKIQVSVARPGVKIRAGTPRLSSDKEP
jgi:hypothetical protein